jgi:hypothetical protein
MNQRSGEIPFPEGKNPKIYLMSNTRIGSGVEIHTVLQESPAIAKHVETLFSIDEILPDSQVVLFTPQTETLLHPLPHPIFAGDMLQRGIYHHRSFGIGIHSKSGKRFTLNIKHGDILNPNTLRANLYRLGNLDQIPGTSSRKDVDLEFLNALALQKLALAKLKRLTHSVYPLSVKQIATVPQGERQVDIRSFLNSSGYLQLSESQREEFHIQEGVLLGDHLLHSLDMIPCEFLYICEGENIRVEELASLIIFNEMDDQLRQTDPLAFRSSGLQNYGQFMEFLGKNYDETIRGVYTILGKAYGVSVEGILPVYPITPINYVAVLRDIRESCANKGIAEKVMTQFIANICEVAALGHAGGYTFTVSHEFGGGSLNSRNTTYTGNVLDLNNMRSMKKDPALNDMRITLDLQQLIVSVACMRRVVSPTPITDLFDHIAQEYLEKLQQFSSRRQRMSIENYMSIGKVGEETIALL